MKKRNFLLRRLKDFCQFLIILMAFFAFATGIFYYKTDKSTVFNSAQWVSADALFFLYGESDETAKKKIAEIKEPLLDSLKLHNLWQDEMVVATVLATRIGVEDLTKTEFFRLISEDKLSEVSDWLFSADGTGAREELEISDRTLYALRGIWDGIILTEYLYFYTPICQLDVDETRFVENERVTYSFEAQHQIFEPN